MKRMLSVLLITAIVLTFGLVPVSAAYSTSVPAAGQVVTQRDPLNIRSGAGTGYRIVGEAPKGTYLQIVGESGNFYKVVYTTSGKTGYAAKQYLKIVSTGTGTIATLRDPLVLRGSPSTSGSNLAQIPKGKVVPLLGKSSDGKWLKVVYGNKIGWCAASYISVAGSTTSTAKKTTITFSSISNPGTITQGNGVHISGTITSTNSKLTSVTASIVNASGKTVVSKSVNPNAYSFSIYNSELDWAMTFGSLSAGNYTLKYDAKTADGTKNSKSVAFTVKAITPDISINNSDDFGKTVYSVAHVQLGQNYKKYGAGSTTPWCGYYVTYILRETYDRLGSNYNQYVPYNSLHSASQIANAYKNGTYGTYYAFTNWSYNGIIMKKTNNITNCNPKPGDIVLTETQFGVDDGPDHVDIIIKVNSNGSFVTSEGNTGSGSISTRTVKEYTYNPVSYNGVKTWQRAGCNGTTCLVHMICSVMAPK